MYRGYQNTTRILSNMRIFSLFVLLCYIKFSAQRSTPEDDNYVAAVLEYETQSTTAMNLNNYINYIHEAAAQNADILVFPESTLTRGGSVAIPINGLLKEYPIPALQPELYDEILVSISEAARLSQIYVVINLQEIVDCTDPGVSGEDCPAQRRYLFNTNVVFDRTGAVIDRYRKINLFGEFSRTPALTPDLGVFETDFGVTFGHFICFDLMFQVPAIQTVLKLNVNDVVFNAMWFSEMPYLTAVQIQQAYAYTTDVNLLAAGANNPRVGSAGSGIYSGRAGALVSIMPGLPTTRLLVATVPKVPGEVTGRVQGPILHNPLDQDSLILISDPSLESHQTRLLTNGTQEFLLFDKDVVCHFRVRMAEPRENTTYRYRASAFSGVRSFSGMATGGSRVCAVFACTGNTIDTCGKRFDQYTRRSTIVFERLEITANVPMPLGNVSLGTTTGSYFPVSLTSSLMPLNNAQFIFETIPSMPLFQHIMILRQPTDELYSFGIWGREYTRDGQEASPPVDHDVEPITTTRTIRTTTTPAPTTPGGSVSHHISLVLLIFSISLFFKQIYNI